MIKTYVKSICTFKSFYQLLEIYKVIRGCGFSDWNTLQFFQFLKNVNILKNTSIFVRGVLEEECTETNRDDDYFL